MGELKAQGLRKTSGRNALLTSQMMIDGYGIGSSRYGGIEAMEG